MGPLTASPFVAVLPSQAVLITIQESSVLYTYDEVALTLTPSTAVTLPQLPLPVTYPTTVSPAAPHAAVLLVTCMVNSPHSLTELCVPIEAACPAQAAHPMSVVQVSSPAPDRHLQLVAWRLSRQESWPPLTEQVLSCNPACPVRAAEPACSGPHLCSTCLRGG